MDGTDAWPRRLNRGLLIGAATIVLLALLGGILTQATDLRQSNALHLQLEYFAVFAAISIFFLSSAKYAISRERVYLPLSLGFLGAAILDLLHPLVPHGTVPASAEGFELLLQDLDGYLWWLSRLSVGVGFLGAAVALRKNFLDESPNNNLVRGLLWTFAQLVFLVALVVLLPLPTYYGPGGVAPFLEVVALFVLAAAGYVLFRVTSEAEPGLRIAGLSSLAIASVAQFFSATSTSPGDPLFFVAHAFKITSYLVVLFGLYLEHVTLYAQERRLRQDVQEAEREALRRRAELFAIIENTADGIAILDPKGSVVHLNRAAHQLLGLTEAAVSARAQLADLVASPARDMLAKGIGECLANAIAVKDIEIEVRDPRGANRFLSVSIVPLADNQGLVQGAVADLHNVTSLRLAEQRYRELTEGAPDGIIEMEQDGRIAFVNRAAERIFGYSKESVTGRDISLLLPDGRLNPGSRSAILEPISPSATPVELVGKTMAGQAVAIELTASKTTFNGAARVTAVVRDVQQLQRTRREKAALVAVSRAVGEADDLPHLAEAATQALRSTLGYDAVAIYLRDVRKPSLVLAGIAATDAIPSLEAVAPKRYPLDAKDDALPLRAFHEKRALTATGDQLLQTRPLAAAAGITSDAFVSAIPILHGGNVVAVLTAIMHREQPVEDELVVLQAAALHLGLGMGQKILLEELRATARNLAVTNRELDSFIYTASHDLAEPLRSMSNFSQFLMEDYRTKLDEQGNDHLRRIHEGALRMRGLLDVLLQVSRIRHTPLVFESVDVGRVLDDVRESLDAMLKERGGDLVVGAVPARVWGQPARILEVFNNLVSNGLKFNESSRPTVEVLAQARDGFLEFRVKDNGIGIPAQYRDRVFGLFARLHPRGRYPGTGAGLAIVRSIVEQHGGQIRVESAEGQGTTVVFTLPQEPQ